MNGHILNYQPFNKAQPFNGANDVNYSNVMNNNPDLGNSLQQTTQSVIGKTLQPDGQEAQMAGPMPIGGEEKPNGSW